MAERKPKRSFALGLGNAQAWIKSPKPSSAPPLNGAAYAVRLPIDGPPGQRSRSPLAAFQRGGAVADRLREIPESAFPDHGAAAS